MAVSFNKAAIEQGIGVVLGTLIRFGLMSAAISLALVLVAWVVLKVQVITGNTPAFQSASPLFPSIPPINATFTPPANASLMGVALNVNPVKYLSQYPVFKYMGYIQYLWYFLLFPLFLGTSIYFLILSQGEGIGEGRIVDYPSLAWDVLAKTAIVLILWIFVGGIVLVGLMVYPQDYMQLGLAGLSKLGGGSFWSSFMQITVVIFPYFPIVVEVGAHVYLLKEVYAGWIGNQW